MYPHPFLLKTLRQLKKSSDFISVSDVEHANGVSLNEKKNLISLIQNGCHIYQCSFNNSGQIESMTIDSFHNLRRLRFLSLGFLQLHAFKIEDQAIINNIPSIRVLFLKRQGFTKIPNLSSLRRLEVLSLSFNNIQKCNWFGDLPNLWHLDLSYNKINNIEELRGLEGCNSLRRLNLSNNNIKHINDIKLFFILKSLEIILFSANGLENICLSPGHPSLKYLDLTFNNIKHIKILDNFPYLSRVHLKGNPLERFEISRYYCFEHSNLEIAFPYKEFIINQYISLRLIDAKTVIIIGGKEFLTCKSLLFNIPISRLKEINKIESYDNLSRFQKLKSQQMITPEDEFWGHCSNLQFWFENRYNSCLLDHKLAFPLLKELTNAGDPIAKKVFVEEIARRFNSGNLKVRQYLIKEGFLGYLSEEEMSILSKY